MNFKQFYLLSESPDIVFTNKKEKLNWSNKDARAFGWLNIMPNIAPFLLYTVKSGSTHFELVDMVFDMFKTAKLSDTKKLKQMFNVDYKAFFNFFPSFNKVIDNIFENKKTWSDLITGKLSKKYYSLLRKNVGIGDEEKPISTQMVERQVGFSYSGRIWLKSKIISFWAMDVPRHIVNEVFDAYNVSLKQRETYLIDLIDPDNLNLEETENKILPTIAEYFSREAVPKKISKEQQSKISDLMSKRHTESDPIKKKQIAKELTNLGISGQEEPNLNSQKMPLYLKQQLMTSESIKRFD